MAEKRGKQEIINFKKRNSKLDQKVEKEKKNGVNPISSVILNVDYVTVSKSK